MSRAVSGSKHATVVEEIVESLCHAIFREEYKTGEKLPPLRTLAKSYGVTLPTMQRVIARMEELGVIAARQGSGVTVLDPLTNATPSAMIFWLEVLKDEPSKAVTFLRSFVEVRRDLALMALMGMRGGGGLSAVELGRVEEELARFEAAARVGMSREEAFQADFGLMRTFLSLRPKIAISVILNMFEQLIGAVPEIQEAVYAHPERNAMGYRAVIEVFKDRSVSDAAFREQVLGLLTTFDMVSMAKFEAILTRG